MARVLVTGAGGYIGRHLCSRLENLGHEVITIYRSVPDIRTGLWRCGVDLVTMDPPSAFIGFQVPDAVIHLAGRIDINLLRNPKGPHLPPIPGPCDIGALYRDNVVATANVVQYCLQAGVKRLIFASTQAVYGPAEIDGDEELLFEPLDHYAASKHAAETVVDMARQQGLCCTILRLPGVYGGDKKSGAVYDMCKQALTKGKIHAGGNVPIPYTALHIDDVLDAFVCALRWTPPNDAWDTGFDCLVTDMMPCNLHILAKEIADVHGSVEVYYTEDTQPTVDFSRSAETTYPLSYLGWFPKPRKERLRQVLEEIRNGP